MKKLKYLLLIFIIFLTPKVFALEYNLNSHTSAVKNGTTNRYKCLETYLYGSSNTCTFGTKYNGRMGEFDAYINYPFEGNTNYVFTLNMASDDFRNNFKSAWVFDCEHDSISTVYSVNYISYRKIKINYIPSENTTCARLLIRSKNYSSDAFTGVNNWTLSSLTLYDPDYQTGSGSGQGSSSPTPTPTSDYSSIINNQDDNTQDIINNQNDNTSDIIENNNENTNKIIDSMTNDCENLINLSQLTLIKGSNRTLIYTLPNSLERGTYTLSYNYESNLSPNLFVQVYVAGQSGVLWKSFQISNTGITTFSVDYTFSTFYFFISSDDDDLSSVNLTDLMLVKGSSSKPYCEFGSKLSKIDETTNAINKQNDYLMDNSNPNISDNEFTSLFDSVSFNDPLSYLLQLPVQFINAIVNQSNSCQVVNLGTLLGVSITLPCINIGNIIGSQVWDIIDVILSVGLLVVIFKNLYQTFANLITLGGEKEAREKFSMPTPMEFLSIILGGDK